MYTFMHTRNLTFVFLLFLLSACGGGGSSSGACTGCGGIATATGLVNWTWTGGSDVFGQPGYGTKLVADPANMPQALEGAMSWTDAGGNLWLFGGGGAAGYSDVNGLWRFDGSAWLWMNGSDVPNELSVYGAKGAPGAAYSPGARQYSATWTDSSGNLWLLGGYVRTNALGNTAPSNDLWKYNVSTNQWAWMNGNITVGDPPSYTTPPQPGIYSGSPGSLYPGARYGAASWVDASGNFWLFGGKGLDEAGDTGYLNDLWKFDGTNWIWVSGVDTKVVNQSGNYSTPGKIGPGARYGSASWFDGTNLWLFGGYGYDAGTVPGNLSDLWRFDGTNWTWEGGVSAVDRSGTYGTPGIPSTNNLPGGRRFSATWKDSSGKFWLFGGGGYDWAGGLGSLNDLWKLDPVSKSWSWMSGTNTINQTGIYGTMGSADPANVPGNRDVAVSWANGAGLWLFGGQGVDSIGFPGYYNDFWRFQP